MLILRILHKALAICFMFTVIGHYVACGGGGEQTTTTGPPAERDAAVEEADLYRIREGKLFYLNTHKGLMIFDLADKKNPKQISQVAFYGYPVEMFVEQNTAYVLIRDVSKISKAQGQFSLQRQNTSQLLSIDISNPYKPEILEQIDIPGLLREGVSRKIENSLYVVSYLPTGYSQGWFYEKLDEGREQVAIHSFDISDPRTVRKIQQLKLMQAPPTLNELDFLQSEQEKRATFESNDHAKNEQLRFSGVTITATSNVLMVGELWTYYRRYGGCAGGYSYDLTRVNLVDVSDPKGTIRLHSQFQLRGSLTDQFKQTYFYDPDTNSALYLGIFLRTDWSYGFIRGNRTTRNTLLSFDVSNGKQPILLDELVFGKKDETVRGSIFDGENKILYAITAIEKDPLYAISFEQPAQLKIMSEIDGLSGDVSLFRFLENRKFLLAVGRDTSATCLGFGDASIQRFDRVAVSIFDVRDPYQMRLVQRKCFDVEQATRSFSPTIMNRDQAHKMIGLSTGNERNLLTVPIYYNQPMEKESYSLYRTAIGMMSWDLSLYDEHKTHDQQQVLQNVATLIHPNGLVKRTIFFSDQENTSQMLLNLSDSHLSLFDVSNLQQPLELSTIEFSPYVHFIYRFGDYLLEHTTLGSYSNLFNEFRVKKLDQYIKHIEKLEDAPTIAAFSTGPLDAAIRWRNKMALFSKIPAAPYTSITKITLYDFATPSQPQYQGEIEFSSNPIVQYNFYCGPCKEHERYQFGSGTGYNSLQTWVHTNEGLAFVLSYYDSNSRTYDYRLTWLNLQGHKPIFNKEHPIARTSKSYRYNIVALDNHNFVLISSAYSNPEHHLQIWSLSQDQGWHITRQFTLPHQPSRFFYIQNSLYILCSFESNKKLMLYELPEKASKAMYKDEISLEGFYLNYAYIAEQKLYVIRNRRLTSADYNDSRPEIRSSYFDIYDLSAGRLQKRFSDYTSAMGLQILAAHEQNLVMRIGGEGILISDVADPSKPQATHFLYTRSQGASFEIIDHKFLIASGFLGSSILDPLRDVLR